MNSKFKIINNGDIKTNDETTIKIRGKSTSMASEKRVFRIKFTTQHSILEFPRNLKKLDFNC